MKLNEFGQELEKQFGWDFARLTKPRPWYERLGTLITGFFKGEPFMKSETTGKTLREDVQDILLSNRGIQPDAMVAELKTRGHSEENINKFLGPRGEK